MKFYIGTHEHKHGVSTYLFRSKGMTEMDFITFLAEDYEPDRDDEFIIFSEETPIQYPESLK